MDTAKHPKAESYALVKELKKTLQAELPEDDAEAAAKLIAGTFEGVESAVGSGSVFWFELMAATESILSLPSLEPAAAISVPAPSGGQGGRGVPDVAGDADPNTGYQVLVDGQSMVVGGTSAVAPHFIR